MLRILKITIKWDTRIMSKYKRFISSSEQSKIIGYDLLFRKLITDVPENPKDNSINMQQPTNIIVINIHLSQFVNLKTRKHATPQSFKYF